MIEQIRERIAFFVSFSLFLSLSSSLSLFSLPFCFSSRISVTLMIREWRSKKSKKISEIREKSEEEEEGGKIREEEVGVERGGVKEDEEEGEGEGEGF